jgi:hypothetical protein
MLDKSIFNVNQKKLVLFKTTQRYKNDYNNNFFLFFSGKIAKNNFRFFAERLYF